MSAIGYPTFTERQPLRWAPFARALAGRLETVVLALGICLPVPVLAATGLSVPLPNIVERIAASLVPWADEPVLTGALAQGTRGSIIPAASDAADPAITAVPEGTAAAYAPARGKTPPAGIPKRLPAAGARAVAGVATPPAPRRAPGTSDRPESAQPAPAAPAATPATTPVSPPHADDTPAGPPKPPAPTGGGTKDTLPPPPPTPNPTPTNTLPLPVPVPVPATAVPLPPLVEQTVTTVAPVVTDPVGTVTGALPLPPAPKLPGLGG